jgi:hypothetical protein
MSKKRRWLALTPVALLAVGITSGCGGADQESARPQTTPTTLKGRPPANIVDTQNAAETDDNPAEPAGQTDSPAASGSAQHPRTAATTPRAPTTVRGPSTARPPPERPPKPPPTKAEP